MTIAELQAKRDEILARVGEVRVQKGDRSVEYGEASKALATIDAEISRLTAAATNTSRCRPSYATFVKS